jgi:hypothetical protein
LTHALPAALLVVNVGCVAWVRAAIRYFELHAGPGGIYSGQHPSHYEWWSLWVPGMTSRGVLIATALLLLALMPPFGYRQRDLPFWFFLLLPSPTCFFTVWLMLADGYYFTIPF